MTPSQPKENSQSTLSPDVAAFLLAQVNSLTLNVGAPDFEEALAMIVKAKTQLQTLLASS